MACRLDNATLETVDYKSNLAVIPGTDLHLAADSNVAEQRNESS